MRDDDIADELDPDEEPLIVVGDDGLIVVGNGGPADARTELLEAAREDHRRVHPDVVPGCRLCAALAQLEDFHE